MDKSIKEKHMSNPYDPDFDYVNAQNAFSKHKITLAYVRSPEKAAVLQEVLDLHRNDPAMHSEMLRCVFLVGINFRNMTLMRIAEQNGVWNLDGVQGNPAWGAFMYKSFSSSFDVLRPELYEMLSRAASFASKEHLSEWIYLTIQDQDTFEDISKKTERFKGAAALYRQLVNEHGLSDELALNNVMEAISQTMVPYNSNQAEPIFKELDSVFGETPSRLAHWHSIFRKSRGDLIQDLSIYKAACKKYLDSIESLKLNQEDRELFNQLMERVPGQCLDVLEKLDPQPLISLPNGQLLRSIVHGDWLEECPHLAERFRGLVKKLVEIPNFLYVLDSHNRGTSFTGTIASMLTCDALSENNHNFQLSGGDEKIHKACGNLLKNSVKIGFTRFQPFVDAITDEKEATELVSIYDKLESKSSENNKNEYSYQEKLNLSAAIIYSEIVLMREKRSPISENTPFHLEARFNKRQRDGNPLYGVESICKLIMHCMTEKQLLSVAPKNKVYIKALIKDGFLGIEHINKLSAKDKKEFVSADLKL